MSNGIFTPPTPKNESVKNYSPNSPERKLIKEAINEIVSTKFEIPLIIGGKEIYTNDTEELKSPSDNSRCFGRYHKVNEENISLAIKAAAEAKIEWSILSWEDRAGVFLKAANLLTGKWRYKMNAATMLGQGKTVYQAEIDSACELTDFLNFNVHFMHQIYNEQPNSSDGMWNRLEYIPLEGFVLAITPFNFTAIGGNLPTAPALIGNTVLWKPASTSILSCYFFMELLKEAGLPDGVINFIPGRGSIIGEMVLPHKDLAGIHFTGSTEVFGHIWKTIGENIRTYKSYPRIVGETGGKDFLIAHNDCDIPSLATACLRGAFEYQGQKCSALSRAYIPKSTWEETWKILKSQLDEIKMGDVTDFSNFVTSVIDKSSYKNIKSYIEYASNSKDAIILHGGKCDDSKGFYIEPTVILTTDPHFKTMEEEIFGPVLTVYVYEDEKFEETLKLIDSTSAYALTGAIFAKSRIVINKMTAALAKSAGNFYINDKPTGAVVGQQPFGGLRGSGTNDKAGSKMNLLRWTNMRSIKETFVPPTEFKYPHMD
ncbi:MAG TPA: L-glutamate gamma-semialdehyde dehydrogenase [Victivallales bacterium]|nr:L-glutamate gamma-semialdehyde dehydrogenase [Victivallales bacterium]